MKLVIDIGNTTTSLGLWNNHKLSLVTNVENKKIFQNIKKYIKKDIKIIFLASVIGARENKLIKDKLKKIFKCGINQIKSESKLFKITNGYNHPKKLGDDRWAAITGSFLFYQKPLIIIDCGTAISVDIVNTKGKHLGGYIFSGFDGYRDCFKNAFHLKNTKLKESVVMKKKYFPAKTDKGITEGYLLMVVSAIDSIYHQVIKDQKILPRVLITGGYGKIISKNLSIKNKYESNLVLKCLGIISNSL